MRPGRVEALRQFPERVDQQVYEASGPAVAENPARISCGR